MLLFRSEEHIETWYRDSGVSRGATLGVQRLWELARAWYEDRLSPEWRRRTLEEAEGVFANLGLSGDFWRLSG
jgi:hypothetical protein